VRGIIDVWHWGSTPSLKDARVETANVWYVFIMDRASDGLRGSEMEKKNSQVPLIREEGSIGPAKGIEE
jgi:hypothetical protein